MSVSSGPVRRFRAREHEQRPSRAGLLRPTPTAAATNGLTGDAARALHRRTGPHRRSYPRASARFSVECAGYFATMSRIVRPVGRLRFSRTRGSCSWLWPALRLQSISGHGAGSRRSTTPVAVVVLTPIMQRAFEEFRHSWVHRKFTTSDGQVVVRDVLTSSSDF